MTGERTMVTTAITIVKHGSQSFPIFAVYRDTIDSDGYTLEHLSEEIGRFNTMTEAKSFAETAA